MLKVLLAQESHPNKHPFSIDLFPIGVASDGAPFGAQGKKILISQAVAEKSLPTLVGMAVNAKEDLTGHEPLRKIGVFTDTAIENGWAVGKGHFFSYDDPETIAHLHDLSAAGKLGSSIEATHVYAADSDGVWDVQDITFTGATVMLAQMAAWKSTRVAAASSQEKNMPENAAQNVQTPVAPVVPTVDLKPVLDAIAAQNESLTSALTQMTTVLTSLAAAATKTAETPAPVAPVAPVADPVAEKLAAMEKEMATLKTDLAAAQETAKVSAAAPQRRSHAHASTLLAKHDLDGEGAENTAQAIDKLRASGMISPEQSMTMKLEAVQKGLIKIVK
jgi:hypothetical protein